MGASRRIPVSYEEPAGGGPVFIHFSDSPHPPRYRERWNTSFSAGTPFGVYVYLAHARATYGADRRYIHVIHASPGARVLDLTSYDDYARDRPALAELVGERQLARLERVWERRRDGFRAGDTEGARLWYVVTKAKGPDDDDDDVTLGAPGVTNPAHSAFLLRELGYDAVLDRGLGIIWSSEPEQAFFLSDEAFEVVEVIDTLDANGGSHAARS